VETCILVIIDFECLLNVLAVSPIELELEGLFSRWTEE